MNSEIGAYSLNCNWIQAGKNIKSFDGHNGIFTDIPVGTIISATFGQDFVDSPGSAPGSNNNLPPGLDLPGGNAPQPSASNFPPDRIVLDVTYDVSLACTGGWAGVPYGNSGYTIYVPYTDTPQGTSVVRDGLCGTWCTAINNAGGHNDNCTLRVTYTDPHNTGMILSNGGVFSFGIVTDNCTVTTATFAENSTWNTDHKLGSIISAMWGNGTYQWDVAELVKVYTNGYTSKTHPFKPTTFWMGGNPSPAGMTNTLTVC